MGTTLEYETQQETQTPTKRGAAIKNHKHELDDDSTQPSYCRNGVGASLLVAMFLFLVVAIFIGIVKPDVIASAFTLILGYFFGQNASR